MRHFSLSVATPMLRDSSPDASAVKTITLPKGTSAILLTVETTDARVTFDNTAPTTTNGHVIKAGQNPILIPVSQDAVIQWLSTAGAASVVVVTALH